MLRKIHLKGSPDSTQLITKPDGITIIYRLKDPKPEDFAAIQDGHPLEFRFALIKEAFLLFIKPGVMPNSGWDYHTYVPEDDLEHLLDDLPEGAGYPIEIIVSDCETGVIQATRRATLSPEFSRRVKEILDDLDKKGLKWYDHFVNMFGLPLEMSPDEMAAAFTDKCNCIVE